MSHPSSAGPRLLGPAEVRSLAAALDLRPTKQRGQNFVIDANTVRRIVRDSGIGPDDVVLEVGPGPGLADPRRCSTSPPGWWRSRSTRCWPAPCPRPSPTGRPARPTASRWCAADAMRITSVPGPPPTALVANLPYNVSVPVLLHLLALLPSLERGLVMVQSEVADRLAAAPGSKVYGIPSVKAAWFADVRRAGCDRPQRLLAGSQRRLRAGRLDPPRAADAPPSRASRSSRSIDAAFAQRRKALRPSLRGLAGSAEASERRLRRGRDRPDDARRAAAAGRVRADRGGPRRMQGGDMSVTVRAPAKVNLALVVGRPREDGFHPLNTVYQAISLYDDVRVTDAERVERRGRARSARWTSPAYPSTRPTSPCAPAGCSSPTTASTWPRDIEIRKGIPVAGGLAGGSADAAATLVALDRLWDLRTTDEDLLAHRRPSSAATCRSR